MVIKDLGNLSRDELFEAIKEDRLEYAKIFKIYGVVPIALLFMELYRCLRYHETIEIVIAWWLLLISLYLLFSYWRDKKMSTFEDAKELLLYYDKFQKWFKAPFAIALISFYYGSQEHFLIGLYDRKKTPHGGFLRSHSMHAHIGPNEVERRFPSLYRPI